MCALSAAPIQMQHVCVSKYALTIGVWRARCVVIENEMPMAVAGPAQQPQESLTSNRRKWWCMCCWRKSSGCCWSPGSIMLPQAWWQVRHRQCCQCWARRTGWTVLW